MFTDFHKELEMLAKAITNQEPNAGSRVEVMSGGEVLGTALIKWLKDGEEDINVAREVVQAVWPTSGHPRDSPRAWRQGTNLRSTALRGTTSEPCGKRRR